MKSFESHAHISPDGVLTVRLPATFADADVHVIIEASKSKNSNGIPRSVQDRYDSLSRIAGSIDDPTFECPAKGEFQDRTFSA